MINLRMLFLSLFFPETNFQKFSGTGSFTKTLTSDRRLPMHL